MTVIRLPLLAPREPPRRDLDREFALAAVREAAGDVGLGETLANNQSPYIWTLTGRRTRGAWCAAAVYSWYLRGAESLGLELAIKRTHSARTLAKRIAAHGRWFGPEATPERGDVALWARGPLGSWMGHVGIVRRVGERGAFWSIEGNRGQFPALVDTFPHQLGERRLLGFARYW